MMIMLRFLFFLGALVRQSSSDLCTGLASCRCEPHRAADTAMTKVNCSDPAGARLTSLPSLDLKVSYLYLEGNNISSLDLGLISLYPQLVVLKLGRNHVKSLTNSEANNLQFRIGLEELDLSHNSLQVIQVTVLAGLYRLKSLNLSNNQIHTIIQDRGIVVPRLSSLDLSFNGLTEVPELMENIPDMRNLKISHNRVSRITDGTLTSHNGLLETLDLSHNHIMAIDDNSLSGLNLTQLDLGHNKLRRVPSPALTRLRMVESLVLDGNLVTSLETGAVRDIRVVSISIRSCSQLAIVKKGSFSNLQFTRSIVVSDNPSLVYFHPRAIHNVDNLHSLDISNNNLSSLEAPGPRTEVLRMAGNPLVCHCSLQWLQDSLNSRGAGKLEIQDGANVECEGGDLITLELSSPRWCSPLILPLFRRSATVEMGHNISWACRSLTDKDGNSISSHLQWQVKSASGRETSILPGSCSANNRICLDHHGTLTLAYAHPKDRGQFTCVATDGNGNYSRSLDLEVKVLNIILFPVSIAASFVTLSWNTSQSLARDYILQVHTGSLASVRCAAHPFLQYDNIEVNHKMNSYTISALAPDTVYSVMLCLDKNSHKIPISKLEIRTRPKSYMVQLGIVKDYTAIIAVVLVLGLAGFSCIALTVFRLYRFRCLVMTESLDTKNIMSASPSEAESWTRDMDTVSAEYPCKLSPRSYPTWAAEKERQQKAVNAPCDMREKSKLMENEVASPVDDFFESSA